MTKPRTGCLWEFEEGASRREPHDYSGDGGSCVNCYELAPVTEESNRD